MKKILLTGNEGYIGNVLTEVLRKKGYLVTGLDAGFYGGCELISSSKPHHQIRKDIREITAGDLEGVDAVIHLAALSNDPLGEFNPTLTEEINFKATCQLANLARQAGVGRFVYASSQSMYGVAKGDEELDEDKSEKSPLTAYAHTKWKAEQYLRTLNTAHFTVVSLRPSTVFGVSPCLRCDIVFNNLVACAFTTGKIELKSDGKPYRPVIHIRDVAQAFIGALQAPATLVGGESFNVGIPNGNFTVLELAQAAQQAVPGAQLIFTGEHGSDARTYRVSFNKIQTVLKDYFKPEWELERGGRELVDFFRKIDFTEEQFRGMACHRLQRLQYLCDSQRMDTNLKWISESYVG